MKKTLLLLITCLFWHSLGTIALAQDDADSLLNLLGEEEKTTDYTLNAFKSTRVISSHSMEMLPVGALDFRILHRFGQLSQGPKDLFGLDNASMRMAFDYGITPNLTAGIGRSTNRKEIDGFLKYRILWQSKGKRNIPFSLIWASGITINGQSSPFSDPDIEVTFARRIAYYHQLIIGRKFSNKFTMQIAPVLVHRNIVENELVPNNLYAIEIGGRYKLSQRIALMWDYHYVLNRFPKQALANPLSIGVDIETGGHVFQLHFSNAVGMNERAVIADENGNWFKGNIRFGFNMSRIFQIKK